MTLVVAYACADTSFTESTKPSPIVLPARYAGPFGDGGIDLGKEPHSESA